MKLTKKKANQLCYEKWDWHYHNPSVAYSSRWPRFKFNGGDVPKMRNNCPYCELYFRKGCNRCPLKESGNRCEFDFNNYWDKWKYAGNKYYRKKYAKLIRDIAGKELGINY